MLLVWMVLKRIERSQILKVVVALLVVGSSRRVVVVVLTLRLNRRKR